LRGRATSRGCALLAAALVACGTSVDLGGAPAASDASLEAGRAGTECAPCTTGVDCASGTCGQFAGDLFCAVACSPSTPCASSDECTTVTTTEGVAAQVCVPLSGACTPAVPPSSPDGAVLDHCGALNGPTVPSQCKACGKFSNDCQANGCYGGYWCNESERDCGPPPKSCP
jgi:hypothetical protein